MGEARLLCEVDARGVATVTLNRPEVHNAFNEALIADLTATFRRLDGEDGVRAVVLTGAGRSFCAGADLNWMKRMADYDAAENLADARRAAEMLHALDSLRCPTVARVQGSAFAGGMGLIACCDIALAADHAKFAVTEVRIGLSPSTISPYLLAAMGPRAARRYWLTAERFDAAEALRVGLLDGVAPAAALDALVAATIDDLLLGAPGALAACKELARQLAGPVDAAMRDDTAARIARIRAAPEGREGVAAFLEKRPPAWRAATGAGT